MELRHLRHFATLARIGHFGQAATALNLAQPSLSRSIQKLESLLEVSLLDRRSKSVKLTPWGELLLKQAEKLLEQADQMKLQLDEAKRLENGSFVIGTTSLALASLLSQAVSSLAQHYPLLELELRMLPSPELFAALSRGELSLLLADNELLPQKGDAAAKELVCTTFAAINKGFFCRRDHPLTLTPDATDHELLLGDLGRYPMAIPRCLAPQLRQRYAALLGRERDNFAGIIRYEQLQSITNSLQYSDIIVLVAGEQDMAEMSAIPALTRIMPVDDVDGLSGLQLWHRPLCNQKALASLSELLRQLA